MIEPEVLAKLVTFHGHMCPGLALGIRAAEIGIAHLDTPDGHGLMVIVESNMCAIDAVQFLTGCTAGNGNLVQRDHGKNAYTFLRSSDGRGVRLIPRGGFGQDPEWRDLFVRVRAGTATPEDGARFFTLLQEHSDAILAAPAEELYEVREVRVEVPSRPSVAPSVPCSSCGEPTMETRVSRIGDELLCPPCSGGVAAGVALAASPGGATT